MDFQKDLGEKRQRWKRQAHIPSRATALSALADLCLGSDFSELSSGCRICTGLNTTLRNGTFSRVAHLGDLGLPEVIYKSGIRDPHESMVLGAGSWMRDQRPESRIQGPGPRILSPGSSVLD